MAATAEAGVARAEGGGRARAVGCLIYSDARDDGFYQGDIYPKGAGLRKGRSAVASWICRCMSAIRFRAGLERGSRRLSPDEAKTLMRIPVLRFRTPTLTAAAEPWRSCRAGELAGALPLTYHLGPGPARGLEVRTDMETRPV
jgi:N-acetylated-alpha-linked acidic dipeptidase